MALDQNVTPAMPRNLAPPDSVVENEIPTYRAISPLAVIALFFGLMSIFSVTSLFFVVFALAAVVSGALADRKIQRMPDVLTGRRLAQVGMALGIIFGFASVTATVVETQLRKASAAKFARHVVQVIKTRTPEEAFWFKHPPDVRDGRTAQEVIDLMSKSSPNSQIVDMSLEPYRAIKKRLDAAPGEDIRFKKVEFEGGDPFRFLAGALVELHGPGSKDFPEKTQYAFFFLRGQTKNGKTDWWVEELKFPYAPSTAVAPVAPVDDGHGHGHSH